MYCSFAAIIIVELIFERFICRLIIVSRSCQIAADCVAIGVTWFAMHQGYGIRHMAGRKGTLSRVLLLDGIIYFLVLAIVSSVHMAFTLLSLDATLLQGSLSDVTYFTTPLFAICLSRFLLHLQSANLRALAGMDTSEVLTASQNSSLVFERVVGSIGAIIEPEDYLPAKGDWEDSSYRADE
ncbi:hypothetical protein BD309DRAFT_691870 [Dichomitus squalens]|nr:hypothetical protein BD309DRAFT_691870 [Dichomitus squalens]